MSEFIPINGAGKTVGVTATSSSTALHTSHNPRAVKFVNEGSSECFIRLGSGTQTAVVDTDLALKAGAEVVLSIPSSQTDWEVGAICNSTESTDLYFINGYTKLGG